MAHSRVDCLHSMAQSGARCMTAPRLAETTTLALPERRERSGSQPIGAGAAEHITSGRYGVTAENHELTRQQRDIAKSYQKLRQTQVNRRRLLVNAGIAAGLIGAYRMGPETPAAGAAVRARQDAVAAIIPRSWRRRRGGH